MYLKSFNLKFNMRFVNLNDFFKDFFKSCLQSQFLQKILKAIINYFNDRTQYNRKNRSSRFASTNIDRFI